MKRENVKVDLKQTGQNLVTGKQIISKQVKKNLTAHAHPRLNNYSSELRVSCFFCINIYARAEQQMQMGWKYKNLIYLACLHV